MLMSTKLLIPAVREGLVSRPRFGADLSAQPGAKLTLVCAPTGWGKTSVLAQWARGTQGERIAWVAMDAGDREPIRFWRYVAAAIAAVATPAAVTVQRRLLASGVSIADEVLPVLINDLAALTGPLALVLDDYHLVADSAIDAQLGFVIDRLPPGVRVVVAAHADPPLRLGRLRAMGDLSEVRSEQLRFSDQEAEALLNQVHGLDLSAEEVAKLQQRTEGWVAGLNLAALSLKRSPDRSRVLERLPAEERFLIDYLWEEVVLAQPREIRHFLMRTAILEQLTAGLCDAVTERSDSDQVLRELERANVFVIPLDAGSDWFRYHHFFRGLLLAQLQRFAPDLLADLHRRASTWCAEHEMTYEAIEHAIAAGDVHWAADELQRQWFDLYFDGRAGAILSWIDRLGAAVIDAHPALALARAELARVLGRTEEVEPWLRRAERAQADAPLRGWASSLAGAAAQMRSWHVLVGGNVPGAVAWGRRAVELEPVAGSREHATASFYLACALFYQDPAHAAELLACYLDTVAEGVDDVRRCYAMGTLAEHHAACGELEPAEWLVGDALAIVRRRGLQEGSPTEQVHLARGVVALARGELDRSEDELERAVMLARRSGGRITGGQMQIAHAMVWLACVRAQRGDLDQGRATLDAARALVPAVGESIMGSRVQTLERELERGGRRPGGPVPEGEPEIGGEPISDAELRVLRLLPGDLSYPEIARHLYLSRNTVRTHASRLRRKLGASSRIEVVSKARERGLL